MLSPLSYFNLIFAVIYAIIYLRNATLNSFIGIAFIVFFNWLALLAYQKDAYRWRWFHLITAALVVYTVGFFAYGWINVLRGIIEADFVTSDNLYYLVLTALFCVSVLYQVGLFFRLHLKAIKETTA